jgi:formimidoylglutamate deiminase
MTDPIIDIDDGRIVRCRRPGDQPQDGDVRRLAGRLVVPGLIDAHSHAFQRAFRGHVQWSQRPNDDFWSWREAMYSTAARLTPEGVYAVSKLAFLELIEAGVTHVGEFHYLHHQPDGQPYEDRELLARTVIAAAQDVGLRITLLWVLYGRGGWGAPVHPTQRRFLSGDPQDAFMALDRLAPFASDRVRLGMAPHSVRAVPPSWWPEIATFEGVVHVHVAEQRAEVDQCRGETGDTPLSWIARHGVLSPRFSAVHLTHPTEREVQLVEDAGANVVVCPSTELDLADGFLPLAARRLELAIGSDSYARVDPWDEVRSLELHGRGITGSRRVFGREGDDVDDLAARLLRIATAGGSRSLGLEHGGIAAGAPADLTILDLRRPAAAGQPPLVSAVFSANPDWVEEVWVGGQQRVFGGRHPDRDSIVFEALPWLGP